MNNILAIDCLIDGKALPNGKAYAIALFDKKKRFYWVGEGTNNEAEYQGLILALKNSPENSEITIKTDSQLVHGQMNEGWAINYTRLFELNQEAIQIIENRKLKIKLEWIPRKENIADLVLNRHLQKIGILPKESEKCPYCKGTGWKKIKVKE